MAEDKKIVIKKNGNFRDFKTLNTVNGNSKTQRSIDLLEQTVKRIENKYKVFGFSDSKEEDFFNAHQGKDIVLEIQNGKKAEGKLFGIDKFRICIDNDGIKKYYFKHAILCYFAK